MVLHAFSECASALSSLTRPGRTLTLDRGAFGVTVIFATLGVVFGQLGRFLERVRNPQTERDQMRSSGRVANRRHPRLVRSTDRSCRPPRSNEPPAREMPPDWADWSPSHAR